MEKNRTIYVRVHEDEGVDTSIFLEGFWEEEVCVYGNRYYQFYGKDEYERIYENINRCLDDESDVEDIKYYCHVESDEQANKIHDILDECYHQRIIKEDELFPAIMEVVTGKKYYHSTIRGVVPREWAECIYPEEYGYDYDKVVECVFFGLGAEIEISENDPDFKDSYWDYVTVECPNADDIRKYVSNECYDSEATIKLFKPRKVTSYVYDEYND